MQVIWKTQRLQIRRDELLQIRWAVPINTESCLNSLTSVLWCALLTCVTPGACDGRDAGEASATARNGDSLPAWDGPLTSEPEHSNPETTVPCSSCQKLHSKQSPFYKYVSRNGTRCHTHTLYFLFSFFFLFFFKFLFFIPRSQSTMWS